MNKIDEGELGKVVIHISLVWKRYEDYGYGYDEPITTRVSLLYADMQICT